MDDTSDHAVELVQFLVDAYQSGYVPDSVFTSKPNSYYAGVSAQYIGWACRAFEANKKGVGGEGKNVNKIAPILNADKHGTLMDVQFYLIPKCAPENAKKLAKVFLKEQLLQPWVDKWNLENYGKLPNRIEAFEGLPVDEPFYKLQMEYFNKSPPKMKFMYRGYQEHAVEYIKNIQRAMKGEITAEEACKETAKYWEEQIKPHL